MPERLNTASFSGLYALADAAMCDPVAWGTALAMAGCSVIQLRAKTWPVGRIHQAATALRAVTADHGCLLIINDHPAIACSVGADGVHLGQSDLTLLEARTMIGPSMLIGLSTHTLPQVWAATDADYIGFGPIFPTHTKASAGPSVGTSGLSLAVRAAHCPVVAIGGITALNLGAVREAGAHSWAVASALTHFDTAQKAVAAMDS